MRKIYCLASALFCLLVTFEASSATVFISDKVNEDLGLFLGGESIESIDNFDRPAARREVVEVVLLHLALKAGGYPYKITIVAKNLPYLRGIAQVSEGKFSVLGSSVWKYSSESYDNIWISSPIIKAYEYHAGLYTSPRNQKALKAQNREDISQLTAVSNKTWQVDWVTLKSLPLKHIFHTTDWDRGVLLVDQLRADFMLYSFRAAPYMEELAMKHTLNESNGARLITLVPIPGLKVRLDGTRHWVVSKKDKFGPEVYSALEKGIKILDDSGVRLKAFRESHFLSKDTESWQLLN
ncbi:hypothetical protein [Teredinibacter sp. KSP-S5-2]|uniref:hypothetical protein n=1 Tax=Teredinibacter sp. KSP-S5-2 TaxID=3034506 RepID=UPI002934CD18|nr:hypothetical protein [Teredinibacter sp. KSP-S5-2]WNO08470.1 hypothetical protein P5V12_15980 [Teredinibacter sp. KSP-S5-2]